MTSTIFNLVNPAWIYTLRRPVSVLLCNPLFSINCRKNGQTAAANAVGLCPSRRSFPFDTINIVAVTDCVFWVLRSKLSSLTLLVRQKCSYTRNQMFIKESVTDVDRERKKQLWSTALFVVFSLIWRKWIPFQGRLGRGSGHLIRWLVALEEKRGWRDMWPDELRPSF